MGDVKTQVFSWIVVNLLTICPTFAQSCIGKIQSGWVGTLPLIALNDGGFASLGKMNIDIDGYSRAYNPGNYEAGAVVHLCNAGRVYLADGSRYEGSESDRTCTGRFVSDFKRIREAGWTDSSTGAISWYGIVGTGEATIHGKQVRAVIPVTQFDGSGFFVSQTSLADPTLKDVRDQQRYLNPLKVPYAVVPAKLLPLGIKLGSFGVAIDPKRNLPVPFVVGDIGPRIGEGSVALGRLVAGKQLADLVTRETRNVGQVDQPRVLWVFFGGRVANFDHNNEAGLVAEANQVYQEWGGDKRLKNCAAEWSKQLSGNAEKQSFGIALLP
jgi:hypothetical protein